MCSTSRCLTGRPPFLGDTLPAHYEVTVDAGSTEEIDGILDAIGRIEGIERTQTSIVLSVKFER